MKFDLSWVLPIFLIVIWFVAFSLWIYHSKIKSKDKVETEKSTGE